MEKIDEELMLGVKKYSSFFRVLLLNLWKYWGAQTVQIQHLDEAFQNVFLAYKKQKNSIDK